MKQHIKSINIQIDYNIKLCSGKPFIKIRSRTKLTILKRKYKITLYIWDVYLEKVQVAKFIRGSQIMVDHKLQ